MLGFARRERAISWLRHALRSAKRLVVQSIAWAYAPGPKPHRESDPLDIAAEGARAVTVGGVSALETLTLGAHPVEGSVLRYGHLYGPGTGTDVPDNTMPLHVDAAAHAALLAITAKGPGIYNIAEADGNVAIDKAARELGWSPDFRLRQSRRCLKIPPHRPRVRSRGLSQRTRRLGRLCDWADEEFGRPLCTKWSGQMPGARQLSSSLCRARGWRTFRARPSRRPL